MTTRIGGWSADVHYTGIEQRLSIYPEEMREAARAKIEASWKDGWLVEPGRRHRYDVYQHGSEKSERELEWEWEEQYARPLVDEVKSKIEERFGKDLFWVYITDKGNISVDRR
jgi:hypothetical protein